MTVRLPSLDIPSILAQANFSVFQTRPMSLEKKHGDMAKYHFGGWSMPSPQLSQLLSQSIGQDAENAQEPTSFSHHQYNYVCVKF